jgi:hypothetical protein
MISRCAALKEAFRPGLGSGLPDALRFWGLEL